MSDWAEATTEDGKKFYYHKKTRKSLWDKPEEMIQYENALNSAKKSATPPWASSNSSVANNNQVSSGSVNNNNSSSNSSNSNNNGPIWKEYITKDGKKYYHNLVTGHTSWDAPDFYQPAILPNNVQQKQQQQQQIQQSSGTNMNQSSGSTSGREIFIELLKENEIGTTWTSDRAFRLVATDERYQALKTMTERKLVFSEYIAEKKRTEMEEKKKKEKKNRDDYLALLKETPEINPLTTWRHASLILDGNPRFEALDSERDREDLYKLYLDDMEKQEKDETLEKKTENMKLLKQKFEQNPSITFSTQWRKVRDEYETDPLYTSLDNFDFLSVFEAHIRELEKKQDDLKRLEREKQKRESRKDRDAFRQLLADKYQSQELHALTRWKEFHSKIQNLPEYEKLSQQTSGSSPLDLFVDFKEDLEKKYEKDYKKLKDIVRALDFNYVPQQTTIESFKEAILKHEKISTVSPQNFLPFLEYLRYKEESKEKSLAKKKKKQQKHFQQLLSDQRNINAESTWQQVKQQIQNEKYFEELADEDERERLFNQHLEYVKKYLEENPPSTATNSNGTIELEDGEEGELIEGESNDLKKKRPHNFDYNNNNNSNRMDYDQFYDRNYMVYDIDDRPFKKDKRR
ncbi:WW domain-containing protein [Tieghemostelium lacteum]|uniref:WW domain-containing protein n=1 Tax=Tieghemostelium lacteum TaxID=361077 RepID=A0A151Z6B1_TIELA|nr:WW domain-containing protein [Tieghemostelium lacteum]|eukprot:KYQ89334.1 WW domain-containing protein [Tieghemostelium lacteum]